ncbi:MAG TPA: LTA synthase family protein [Stellaceae bacterium]|nr:LTA synthase family protein [Stellaceae bacterium]
MSDLWHGALGLVFALAGWTAPRRVAGAEGFTVSTWLDAAPPAFVALVAFVACGRPVFAGAVVFALGAGFAFVDRTMRDTLREPIVFSALSELPQVFTHPQLYLPFAGTGLVLGGVAAAIFAGGSLLLAEPALMAPHPLGALALFVLVAALLRRLGREPWLGGAARALRRLHPTGEPFADAARLGPVAMLIVHGIVARAERPLRQARLAPRSAPIRPAGMRPVVLIQCESFFNARRALPTLPRDFLAGYEAACDGGAYGRLDVPAWGANTMRAEFASLTGIDDAALGYDRFNPYHALARVPIRSQVWRLREAGYRTICLHPFDRRFFRRDLAMPALGFEQFLGRETLGGSRTPPYQSDPELAAHILRIIENSGPRVFIFAITMGNHGPWLKSHSLPPGLSRECTALLANGWPEEGVNAHGLSPWTEGPRVKPGQRIDDISALIGRHIPQRQHLLRYLAGLRQSDVLLRLLIDGLEQRQPHALLGFYGDHLPSLPRAFSHLGFDDWRSDYAIWSGAGGVSRRRDLAAHQLGRVLVDCALAPRNRAALDAVVPEPHDA